MREDLDRAYSELHRLQLDAVQSVATAPRQGVQRQSDVCFGASFVECGWGLSQCERFSR